jgi:hypothetical protein
MQALGAWSHHGRKTGLEGGDRSWLLSCYPKYIPDEQWSGHFREPLDRYMHAPKKTWHAYLT